MGDASIKTEKNILNNYKLGKVDILKCVHHVRKTSTSKEFVQEIQPDIALISAGVDNKFNHPHDNVLDNLKKSKIYRTDHDGNIVIKLKKIR